MQNTRNEKIYITVPNAQSLHRRIGFEAGLLRNVYEFSQEDVLVDRQRYYDLNSLTSDCESAGLTIHKTKGLFLKPIATGQIQTLNLAPFVLGAFCKAGLEYPELCNALLIEASM